MSENSQCLRLTVLLIFIHAWAIPSTSAALVASSLCGQSAVVAPFWFGPVIELAKLAVNKLHKQRDTRAEITKNVRDIEEESKGLEPLPKLLVDSRQLRRNAIELAQAVRYAARDESSTEALWASLQGLGTGTNEAFKRVYDASDFRKLMISSVDMQAIEDEGRNALRNILEGLNSKKTSNKEHRDILAQMAADLNAVTKAGQYPEYWITVQSQNLVDGYKQLSRNLTSTTRQDHAEIQSQARLMAVAFSFDEKAALPSSNTPEYLQLLQQEVAAPVEPPAWLLASPRASHETGFGGFGGGLIAGLAGGVIGLKIYEFARTLMH